jgi:hypothetical protein
MRQQIASVVQSDWPTVQDYAIGDNNTADDRWHLLRVRCRHHYRHSHPPISSDATIASPHLPDWTRDRIQRSVITESKGLIVQFIRVPNDNIFEEKHLLASFDSFSGPDLSTFIF